MKDYDPDRSKQLYWLQSLYQGLSGRGDPAGGRKGSVKKECIQCGHCVAVCPVKAVSIPEYDMEEVEEYDRDTFTLDPEIFLHAVKFRRSIRNYKETPVEREKMERILNAGRYAATAKNTQAAGSSSFRRTWKLSRTWCGKRCPGSWQG